MQDSGSRSASDLHYQIGDATLPSGTGKKVIAHVCNDRGGWGRGFVLALSARWPEPEKEYRKLATTGLRLGSTQFVQVEASIWVANMVAQQGVTSSSNPVAIRYEALDTCLMAVGEKAMELGADVHMPRIGVGLGGGSWEKIEPKLMRLSQTVPVFVYDLPSGDAVT